MKKPPVKRLILINRDFQCRYMGVAMTVGIISSLISFATILAPLYFFRMIRFPEFLPAPFLVAILVAAILNFALVAYGSLLITHRIAGPMFSIVRQMHLIVKGKWNIEIGVRENDDLKYLVRNFSELIDYLKLTAKNDLEALELIERQAQNSDKELMNTILGLKKNIHSRVHS